MSSPTSQFRQTLRRLIRAPRFTLVAVLTLGAGVGANAALFGVLNAVLLKPLPYREPDRLVGVWHTAPGVNIANLNMSPANYLIYREQGRVFEDVGVFQATDVSLIGTGEPEQLPALEVSEGVLPILGVVPEAGRLFTSADAVPKSPATVILTHQFWQKKFAGQAMLGHSLKIDGVSREIVGLLPKEFRFLDRETPAMLLPHGFNRDETHLGGFSYDGLARLKPGVTLDQANADVGRMLPIVLRSFPAPEGFSVKMFEDAHISPKLRPLKQDVVGDVGGLLTILMSGIAIVLLIACASVTNLWLVRLEGRRRELTVRAALGAGRGRIAGELALECLIIGAASASLALAIAFAAIKALVALAPTGLPRLAEIHLDVSTTLFTLVVGFAASGLAGVLPIVRYAASRHGTGLRETGRSLSHTREQHRFRAVLVVLQVALAVVLLIGSGLMFRTFRAMTGVSPGFSDPAHLQTLRVYLPSSSIESPDQVIRTQQAMRERLQAIPGVSAVAVGTNVPMDDNNWTDPVFAQDRAYKPGELPKLRRFKFVLPGYFDVIGTPLVAGRDLTWPEIEHHTPVAVISRDFAAEYWGTPQRALGKRIRVGTTDDWREIVGVVADVHDDGVSRDAVSTVYWPMIQERFESDKINIRRGVVFAIRSSRAGSDALVKDARAAIWSIDRNLPLFSVRTLDELYRRSLARTSFTLILLGVAGGMALLLGIIGLYGVIAYSVSQRTHEIGIRMALGAQPRIVTGMFLRDGLRLTVIGVVTGVIGALATVRLMSSLLFHVSAMDPLTYALVSAGLLFTSAVATYVPSRKAAAVDPAIALRGE